MKKEPKEELKTEDFKTLFGDAELRMNNMLTAGHKQAWLEKKTGNFLKHQTEISQKIENLGESSCRFFSFSRDY